MISQVHSNKFSTINFGNNLIFLTNCLHLELDCNLHTMYIVKILNCQTSLDDQMHRYSCVNETFMSKNQPNHDMYIYTIHRGHAFAFLLHFLCFFKTTS